MDEAFEQLPADVTRACVDIGGTKVSVTLAARAGFVAHLVEPTVRTGPHDALGVQVLGMIDAACAQAGVDPDDLDAVGVASCGPLVVRDGLVEVATPNICGGLAGLASGPANDWTSAVLEAPLRARFERVELAIDGIAALLAERRWGALRGVDDGAYVTWSTGVGAGVCVDGRALKGKNGNAGHFGHIFVNDDPQQSRCGCGNVGDLESQVGGNAIERRFGVDAATLMRAARAGEPDATAAVDALCDLFGRALYDLVVILDLQRVSLGGAVFWHNRDLLLPRLRAGLGGRLPAITAGVELVPAGLGLRVVDYGALALVA